MGRRQPTRNSHSIHTDLIIGTRVRVGTPNTRCFNGVVFVRHLDAVLPTNLQNYQNYICTRTNLFQCQFFCIYLSLSLGELIDELLDVLSRAFIIL